MEDFFRKLEDQSYFCDFVRDFFQRVPAEIADIIGCEIQIDEAKLIHSHGDYVLKVSTLALYLESADPDHYKRAGALLHALYNSEVIKSVTYEVDVDEVVAGGGPVGIHYGDIISSLDFKKFYDELHNEMLSFMLCFWCCDAYEVEQKTYDFDYLRNVSVYLSRNPNLSLETFFMLFKSLMR